MTTFKLIDIKPSPAFGDVVLLVEHRPGWLVRLFGVAPWREYYAGSHRVWRQVPSMRLVSYELGDVLCQLHEARKWREANNR